MLYKIHNDTNKYGPHNKWVLPASLVNNKCQLDCLICDPNFLYSGTLVSNEEQCLLTDLYKSYLVHLICLVHWFEFTLQWHVMSVYGVNRHVTSFKYIHRYFYVSKCLKWKEKFNHNKFILYRHNLFKTLKFVIAAQLNPCYYYLPIFNRTV